MEKQLKHYGGEGYGYAKENGKFTVKATITKEFTKLSEARKYYDSLNEEKALWDYTRGAELLDAHTY